jgi:hypothetical protein
MKAKKSFVDSRTVGDAKKFKRKISQRQMLHNEIKTKFAKEGKKETAKKRKNQKSHQQIQ